MKQTTLLSLTACLFLVTAIFAWVPESDPHSSEIEEQVGYFGLPVTNVQEALALSRKVSTMVVQHYDADQAILHTFQVANNDGVWTIPSHHNYPADGGDQVGRTAGSVLGLEANPAARVSTDPRDHIRLGVLDPADSTAPFGVERGRRITLSGSQDEAILDVVVGFEVPDRQGWYYLRRADEDAVYAVEMSPVLSTRFIDYVNPDLLQVERNDVTQIVFDPHRVNRAAGNVTTALKLTLNRSEGEGGWESPQLPDGQEVDQDAVRQVLDGITRVRLEGVRPLQPVTMEHLQRFGFFTNDGITIWGYEGAVEVQRNNGLRYTMYFGERAPDDGLALTAGIDNVEEAALGSDRFMIVIVNYFPEADRLLAQKLTNREAELRAEFQKDNPPAEDGSVAPEIDPQAVKDALAQARSEHVAERDKLTRSEQDKFLEFFYVIPASVFEAMQVTGEDLFRITPANEDQGTDPETINADP